MSAAAATNVLPMRRRLVPRRMRVTAHLSSGGVLVHEGVFDCTIDALLDMTRRVPPELRAVRLDSQVLGAAAHWQPAADTFADTVPPADADAASERLASQPSPFDALAPAAAARPDTDSTPEAVERAIHTQAAHLLAAERARAWALRERAEGAAYPRHPAAWPDDPQAHIPPPIMQPDVPWPRTAAQQAAALQAAPPSMLDDIRSDWQHTSTRARAAFAACFCAALFSALWWAGVL